MLGLGAIKELRADFKPFWKQELALLGIPVHQASLQMLLDPPDKNGCDCMYGLLGEPTIIPIRTADYPWVREAWETGRPVVVTRERLRKLGYPWALEILEVPLPDLGSVAFHTRQTGVFDEEAVATIRMFGVAMAAGLHRIQEMETLRDTVQTLRTRTEQLQAVTDAMTGFLGETDWKTAGGELLEAALRLTGSRYGCITALDERNALQTSASAGMKPTEPSSGETEEYGHNTPKVTRYAALLDKVIHTGRSVCTNYVLDEADAGGSQGILGVPMRKGTEVIRVIGVADRSGGYTNTEQKALEFLAESASILCHSYRQHLREEVLEAPVSSGAEDGGVGGAGGWRGARF